MREPPRDLTKLLSLVQIVADLRGPEGCPWDKEQDHVSLTPYAIEETHELAEAIESKNDIWMKEELGDVLFQVVLHAQLAAERGAFTLDDVISGIGEKIVRRHPHVFGNEKVNGSEQVLKNWEVLKAQEKGPRDPFALDVPAGLPALQRAAKIGFRTAKIKFDWDNAEQVRAKVREEVAELEEALDLESDAEIRHEIGDVFFSLAQLARHLEMDPEQLGREANRRFEKRFATMAEISREQQLNWESLTLEQKESLWQQAKSRLKD